MEYSNLELFYDVLEKSIEILYNCTRKKYFDLYFDTVKNIISCDVSDDIDPENKERLNRLYSKLSDKDFNPEDIRKSLQAIIIKGYIESKMLNDLTPDSIGFLVGYLISRLTNNKSINILDPFSGSGNLLFSIENHLNLDCNLFAIDNDSLKVNILKSMADLLDTNVEIYLNDTLNVSLKNMDFIVFDSPYILNDDKYILYDYILHHLNGLNDNGYMISILPNDFFEHDNDQMFKKRLLENSSVYGILELPTDIFNSQPKSIVIFKRKLKTDNNCLMVKLPSFNDVKSFNDVLGQIEAWFEKNKN